MRQSSQASHLVEHPQPILHKGAAAEREVEWQSVPVVEIRCLTGQWEKVKKMSAKEC